MNCTRFHSHPLVEVSLRGRVPEVSSAPTLRLPPSTAYVLVLLDLDTPELNVDAYGGRTDQ